MRTYWIAQELCSVLCGDLNGKEIQKRGHVCICVAESLCCIPETNMTLEINYEHESESHSVVSDSLGPRELHSPWNTPGWNTGVGSLSLLQGIFPTQGSNPGLLHCKWILYQLSHKGSPRILEWVAYPFSSGSS